jgi:hypothetical protein
MTPLIIKGLVVLGGGVVQKKTRSSSWIGLGLTLSVCSIKAAKKCFGFLVHQKCDLRSVRFVYLCLNVCVTCI